MPAKAKAKKQGKGKRLKCVDWSSAALCKMDEHCLWVMPGGPCATKTDYKRKGVKLGLREAKPHYVPKRTVGTGACANLMLKDLKKEASLKGVPGRSKMNKQELCVALGYV